MAELDIELFALVFFWVGLWGIINIIMQWLFEQLGTYYDPGVGVLIYSILVIGSFYVLARVLNEKNKQKNEDDDKE